MFIRTPGGKKMEILFLPLSFASILFASVFPILPSSSVFSLLF